MRTEIVRTSERLADIGPAWDALWAGGERSVFQSHGWIAAWWNSRPAGDTLRLCIGLCWAEDRLAALMPLVTRRHRGVRVLEWAAKECSDYCDALIGRDAAESSALEQVWAAVAASGQFDLAYLSHVRPEAALRKLADGRGPMTLRPGYRSAQSLQVQSGGADGQAWFRGLDRAVQDRHARGMGIVGAAGPVAAMMSTAGDPIDALLEEMIALRQQWLARSGHGGGILDHDAAVFRALVKELLRQQTLQVFSLHCGGVLVAALLNIVTGPRSQVFFSAFDPRFDDASPETLVLIEYLIRSFDTAMTEVDLLCVENEGEFSFANARIDLASYVGARTLAGKLALAVGERLDRRRGVTGVA